MIVPVATDKRMITERSKKFSQSKLLTSGIVKLRIQKLTTDQGFIYKVQKRVFFFWIDCVDGVDGNPYVPTFSRYQAAEMFGLHYAKIRNQKAIFV